MAPRNSTPSPAGAGRPVDPRDIAIESSAPRHSLALIFLAGLAAMGAFATLMMVWYRSVPPTPAETLRIAMDEYTAGRFDVALRLSERVSADEEQQPELYRTREFLLGAAGIEQALEEESSEQMRLGVAASAPRLRRLLRIGFPPGCGAEGKRLLGLGLWSAGQFEEAIFPLEAAIAEHPAEARRLLLPLADTRFRAAGGKLERALAEVDRLLEMPSVPTETHDDAILLRSRILAAMGSWDEAQQMLATITARDQQDQVDLTRAQILIDLARAKLAAANSDPASLAAVTPLVDEAIKLLTALNHRNEVEYGAVSRYLQGIAYRLSGRHAESLGILASLRQNMRQPAEAVAAGIEEVELLGEIRQFDDAVLAAKAVIREIGDPVTFDPRWVSLMQFRLRLEKVAHVMRDGGAFAQAVELAKTVPPLMGPSEALQMEALSHRQWGESLLNSITAPAAAASRAIRADARSQFREAGRAYAAVAKLRFSEAEYVDFLWEAIDAYQAGGAYAESLELLENYLRYEERARKPRGLIASGRAHLAMGDATAAVRPLEDCIAEYPRDALRYEARLLAAIARSELGEVEEPRRQLESNLFDGRLSPESPLYRDSLFVLGDLLYRHARSELLELAAPSSLVGRLQSASRPSPDEVARLHRNQEAIEDAILRLEEAEYRDRLFNNIRRSHRAAYLAAEAHRLAAYWPRLQASDPETLESARRQLNQQRLAHLTASHTAFERLRKAMVSEVGKRDELLPWEQSMLRNCFMGAADTLYEMDELELAAAAYQQASQEFLNEPLALEALIQQSRCYDQLGRTADAKRLFQQAAKVLDRIPAEQDPRFARTTRYDRSDWRALIDWLQQT